MSENSNYISFFKPFIGEEEILDVTEALRSGWLTTGKFAKQFEDDFAKYMGSDYGVALNSCTAALHLALEAIGLQEGDLVLVPTYTFAATAEVVRYFKAIPVLVDCLEEDFNMNMEHAAGILAKLAKGEDVCGVPKEHNGAKVIIPVHFGGQAVDVKRCLELKEKYNLKLIEDCAHCCPAHYKDEKGDWKMIGSSADIACYSFYANKTITTGEGGMALTNNEEWADRMRVMSLHGISKDAWKRFSKEGSWYYEIAAPGFKYNMTDIAAAIGVNQLKRADDFYIRRKAIAELYSEQLQDLPGVTIPTSKKDVKHSWHLYVIRVDKDVVGISRNEFIDKLTEAEIGTSVHYTPLHMHPYYIENFNFKVDDFPVALKLFEEVISLPIYPLMSDSEVIKVCEVIKSIALGASYTSSC